MTSRDKKRWVVALGALFLVALAVRLAFTFAVAPEAPPVSDAGTYHGLADNLAGGRGYIRPYDYAFDQRRIDTAEFPPLFPTVLAGVSLVGGDSWTAHRVAMCVVGAATAVLTALLGARIAGRGAGIAAGALAAVWPMLFQSDAIPMAETLFTFLVVGALLAALDRRWALLGLAVGLAALTRSEAYLLVPLLVVPALWRRWRELASAIAVVVLVVSPWLLRNAIVFDELQPGGHNTGTAIAGANCDRAWRGPAVGSWHLACVTAVEAPPVTDEAARAAAQRRAGLDYARHHLGDAPRVAVARVARTWGVYHRLRQEVFLESIEGRDFQWQLFATRASWPVLALAIAGAAIVVTRRRDAWSLLVAPAMVTIATIVTYGNQRFREAAEPSLLVLAVLALGAVVARVRPVPSEP